MRHIAIPAVVSLVVAASVGLARDLTVNFEDQTVGQEPSHLVLTLTGEGTTDNHEWRVIEDASAPSPKKALAILKADALDNGYPAALVRGQKFQNFEATLRFKITGGTVNQAGGMIFRAVDVDHSYLLRASAIDNSLVLLKAVNRRERAPLASGRVTVGKDKWHTLVVRARGSEIQCHFNGARIFTVNDTTYPSGRIGFLSQADSATGFDDLIVRSLEP